MSTRARIRLSDDELAAFLGEQPKMQLATIQADGTPHLATMYYAMVDGRVAFWTYRTSQKSVNLQRDNRCTVLVEVGVGYDDLVGAMIQGTVERVEDEARIVELGAQVYGAALGDASQLGPFLEDQATKRWAYLVTPTKVASWDHRKLAAAYAEDNGA